MFSYQTRLEDAERKLSTSKLNVENLETMIEKLKDDQERVKISSKAEKTSLEDTLSQELTQAKDRIKQMMSDILQKGNVGFRARSCLIWINTGMRTVWCSSKFMLWDL